MVKKLDLNIVTKKLRKPTTIFGSWFPLLLWGHSITTWTEFCHFWPPPLLCGQFLYPELGQKQNCFDPPPTPLCLDSFYTLSLDKKKDPPCPRSYCFRNHSDLSLHIAKL